MVKKVRVVHRKLGKENANGIYDTDKKKIEIDERLKGQKHLTILIHEADHHLCPEWSEEKVRSHSIAMGKILWEQGYRRKKKKPKGK